MAKRTIIPKAEALVEPEESAYKVGVVASFYDDGWRAGTITSVDVDDDGDLLVELQPVGSKNASPKRKVKHKSKDLKLA